MLGNSSACADACMGDTSCKAYNGPIRNRLVNYCTGQILLSGVTLRPKKSGSISIYAAESKRPV